LLATFEPLVDGVVEALVLGEVLEVLVLVVSVVLAGLDELLAYVEPVAVLLWSAVLVLALGDVEVALLVLGAVEELLLAYVDPLPDVPVELLFMLLEPLFDP